MRYTLRLLTLQQFQRASTLICAMELSQQAPDVWGTEPFTLGLWVGGSVTPNRTEDSHDAIEKEPRQQARHWINACPVDELPLVRLRNQSWS